MPALFFPHLNALRLALASGLVPPQIARAPAAAGFDAHGRLWLELAELPPREVLAALGRLGVQALGGTGVPTEPVTCWAELLPLQASPDAPRGPVLFLCPDRQAARFVARLRRSTTVPVGVRLGDEGIPGHAVVVVCTPPPPIVCELTAADSFFEAFAEEEPNVWVRCGWRHPLPDQLTTSPGTFLLVRPPRSVVTIPGTLPNPETEEIRLRRRSVRPPARISRPLVVPVQLHLAPRQTPGQESLWVLDGVGVNEFWTFCQNADERLTRQLEAAHAVRGSEVRLVIRTPTNKRVATFLPLANTGYAPDSRLAGLFVPADRVLKPILRARELSAALGLTADRVVWLEADDKGGVNPHAVPVGAFRPLSELLSHEAPPEVRLPVELRADCFAFNRFVMEHEAIPTAEPDPPLPIEEAEVEPEQPGPEPNEPGWLWRSLQKLVSRLLPDREGQVLPPVAADAPRLESSPGTRRVEQKLASADALRHGPDWNTRRRELEASLFRELPHLGPQGRATRWAALATVYATSGNPTDAAVCWMNAVWESPIPPQSWLMHWLGAECQAAKLVDQTTILERWLSEPNRPGIGRVIAAFTAWAGSNVTPPTEFMSALPRILAILELHFEDLPVRAAWLARLAATRVCDGDSLGLARWRDRVLARLADRGPGLDLDEPSFLRFHGTASADRFQPARKWLADIQEQAIGWIQGHNTDGGRLLWAGLDAETKSTKAYAQFMLAWGLGCLGEQRHSRELAAMARKGLSGPAAPGVEPAAHAVLGDLFLYRVREAQEGRQPKPGLPPDLQIRLDQLSEFARHCVDRLREYSRILEPRDHVRAFRGRDLKEFWGADRLGERLFVLADRTDSEQLASEADALLELCSATPTTDVVPRIVLTLLQVAPRLEQAILVRLVDLLPMAIDWVEAWLATGRWTIAERIERVVGYRARMLDLGFAAVGSLPPDVIGAVFPQVVRRLLALGHVVREPLLAVSGSVFRAVRRLGLTGEAEALIHFLDQGQIGTEGGRRLSLIARLGLAVGWFTAGNEDVGIRILDEAQQTLYHVGSADVRERTELAIAYAEALGFAPRIAHGRLEEIFQRLGRVTVTGSTNRYFTLKPLQLIDAVVRSVVTDEFTLGPAVRSWLDDDEFLIRGRIHRDLAAVLREQGIG